MMGTTEHVTWCKERALQYVDAGNLQDAWASLVSDLRKHPSTENHGAIELGMMLLLGGQLETLGQMREFIEGVR